MLGQDLWLLAHHLAALHCPDRSRQSAQKFLSSMHCTMTDLGKYLQICSHQCTALSQCLSPSWITIQTKHNFSFLHKQLGVNLFTFSMPVFPRLAGWTHIWQTGGLLPTGQKPRWHKGLVPPSAAVLQCCCTMTEYGKNLQICFY